MGGWTAEMAVVALGAVVEIPAGTWAAAGSEAVIRGEAGATAEVAWPVATVASAGAPAVFWVEVLVGAAWAAAATVAATAAAAVLREAAALTAA